MTALDDLTESTPTTRAGSPASSAYSLIEDKGSIPPDAITPDKPSVLNALNRKSFLTILLTGETGTGKTMFMSLLANLFGGRGALDLEDMHDQSKESGLSKSQSQTTTATLYTITTFDGLEIRILDTPGLADTRGIDQDNQHKADINRAIKEYITTIDAVLIMANGSIQRLAAATDYTLNVLTSMFPHSINENIGFIFTNSDPLTWNFQMQSLPVELRESPYWLIQNPLALRNNFMTQVDDNTPLETQRLWEDRLNTTYDETVRTLNKWLEWLDGRPAKPTKEINDLYEKSISIESRIEATLSSMTRLSEQRTQWEKIVRDLRSIQHHKDGIAAVIKQKTAPVWDRQPTDSYNLICITPNCYSNCHLSCSSYTATMFTILNFVGWAIPLHCSTCKHRTNQHRYYKQIHVQKPGELDEETKLEWESAQTEEEKLRAAQNAAQRELDKIEVDAFKTQNELHRLIDDYNSVSLSRNFAGHIRSAIQVLEYRRNELNSKAGTDTELALVDESIAKLRGKLGVIEERTTAYRRGRGALHIVKDIVKSVVPGSSR